MTDNLGFGREKRRALNKDILDKTITFRDAFHDMLASVSENHTFQECQEILKKSE
jgi:2-hydroxy-3-keto-5-methylthiopentenyl-1-phosphate phosphatase